MSFSSVKYLIKEGFRNIWSNRMMSVASVCVLLSCLVLIGSASMMFLNIDSLVDKIEAENVIMVFINDDTDDENINRMGEELKAISNVDKIEFVPKEEAWQEQLATMEEAHAKLFQEISSDIPLPDAYKVTVKDLNIFTQTVNEIKSLDNIYTVRENSDLAQKLDNISRAVSIIAIVIIAVLFAISLFIISNTIKLTVYSRRLEISIMKSVGATNGFVRLPFMVEGMILGVLSAVLSLFAVWGVYAIVVAEFGTFFNDLGVEPLNFNDYAGWMFLIFLGIGIISGVGGSLITMRKYLNKEGSEFSAI